MGPLQVAQHLLAIKSGALKKIFTRALQGEKSTVLIVFKLGREQGKDDNWISKEMLDTLSTYGFLVRNLDPEEKPPCTCYDSCTICGYDWCEVTVPM